MLRFINNDNINKGASNMSGEEKVIKRITCCKGCTERRFENGKPCHAFCERYIEQKSALNRYNTIVRRAQYLDYDLFVMTRKI